MNPRYAKLFEPTKVAGMYLKNRIVMAPMTLNINMEHRIDDKMIDFYAARAKGGVGMIISDSMPVAAHDPNTPAHAMVGTIIEQRDWYRFTSLMKKYDTRLCLQLAGGGGRTGGPAPGDIPAISASENPLLAAPDMKCHALTVDEIHALVDAFASQALGAKNMGFDAVEVHAHIGVLLDQFMSAKWNTRTDEYGGSLENRMRLPVEIVQAIRKVCGPQFPILYRMSLNHHFDYNSPIEERLEMIKILDKVGVDMFDIDEGCMEAVEWIHPPTYEGSSCMLKSAELVKTVTNKPVLSAGNHDHESAAAAVNEGKADYISVARGLLADPDYAKKLYEGREEDVRPCIRCDEFCVRNTWSGLPVICAVNYACGMEKEFCMTKTAAPKNVVIVGAGPGGLEAARVAAEKGHKVTVFEKSDAPFGQVKAAGQPPFKPQLRAYMNYLLTQVKKLGVEIVYNKEITADSPELDQADSIIVAIGSTRIVPPIPGVEKSNVIEVVDAHCDKHGDIGNTVVIAGGGVAGCECGLELAMEGKKVVVVEMAPDFAQDSFLLNKVSLTKHMAEHGVEVLTSHKVVAFEDDGVVVESVADGTQKTLPAETAIMAFGSKPLSCLADEIFLKHKNVKVIGDAKFAGFVGHAVRDAFNAAWSIE